MNNGIILCNIHKGGSMTETTTSNKENLRGTRLAGFVLIGIAMFIIAWRISEGHNALDAIGYGAMALGVSLIAMVLGVFFGLLARFDDESRKEDAGAALVIVAVIFLIFTAVVFLLSGGTGLGICVLSAYFGARIKEVPGKKKNDQ